MHILVLDLASWISNEEIHGEVEMLLVLQLSDQKKIMLEQELLEFFCLVKVMLIWSRKGFYKHPFLKWFHIQLS